MGGAYEPPRDRSRPLVGGPWAMGRLHWLEAIPCGCHGSHPFGWPKAQWPPPAGGGEIHSREASLGGVVCMFPPCSPRVSPPQMAPHIRGLTMSYSHMVMFFTSHIVD